MELIRHLGRRNDGGKSGPHVVAFTTDIGHSHHVNQDAGGAWTWTTADGTPVSLLIVADGVSAGARSEEASRLAVRVIEERLSGVIEGGEAVLDRLQEALVESVREANRLIARRPYDTPARADATTVVAIICVDGECRGVWCGDSRAYKLTSGAVRLLTRDHSWSEEVSASGAMTPEQARRDPRANMITRWLGPPQRTDPGIETFSFRLEPGESALVCSDGLFTYFSDPAGSEEELAAITERHFGKPQVAAGQMVNTALRRGGHDNISVAILQRTE